MPMVPGGLVHYRLLDAEIKSAVEKLRELRPEVVDVAYSMRENWMGDPSLFFRVVLADEATDEDTIADTARRIETALIDELLPIENWGLFPYFNYRRHSDRQRRNEPEWA